MSAVLRFLWFQAPWAYGRNVFVLLRRCDVSRSAHIVSTGDRGKPSIPPPELTQLRRIGNVRLTRACWESALRGSKQGKKMCES